MAVFLNPYQNITIPSDSSWQTINLSSYLPVGATGVILKQYVIPHTSYQMGFRRTGDSESLIYYTHWLTQASLVCGVDSSRRVDIWTGSTIDMSWNVAGYFTTDAAFMNAVNLTPAGTGWSTIDVSSYVTGTPKFAVFKIGPNSGTNSLGVRAKATTPDSRLTAVGNIGFRSFIVPLDASSQCEVYKSEASGFDLYLNGYITPGEAKTNGLDVSISGSSGYVDVDLSSDTPPSNANGCLVEIYNSSSNSEDYAIREKGNTTDDIRKTVTGSGGIIPVGLNSSDIFELYDGGLTNYFYVWGYLLDPDVTVSASLLSLTSSLFVPTVDIGGAVTVTPGLLSETLTLFAPSISTGTSVDITPVLLAESISLLTSTVSTTSNVSITPSILAITITTLSSSVTTTKVVDLTPSVLYISEAILTPTVTAGGAVVVSPGILSETISLLPATITAGVSINVSASLLSATLSTLLSSVTVGIGTSVSPVLQSLSISNFAPSVSTSANVSPQILSETLSVLPVNIPNDIDVQAGVLTISISTLPASASYGAGVDPSILSLFLSTYTPDIDITNILTVKNPVASVGLRTGDFISILTDGLWYYEALNLCNPALTITNTKKDLTTINTLKYLSIINSEKQIAIDASMKEFSITNTLKGIYWNC